VPASGVWPQLIITSCTATTCQAGAEGTICQINGCGASQDELSAALQFSTAQCFNTQMHCRFAPPSTPPSAYLLVVARGVQDANEGGVGAHIWGTPRAGLHLVIHLQYGRQYDGPEGGNNRLGRSGWRVAVRRAYQGALR
jgi:hypothetical protein